MTDLSQIDDLLRRAKGEEYETWVLIDEAAVFLEISPEARGFVFKCTHHDAHEQAALHLMREALPDYGYELTHDTPRLMSSKTRHHVLLFMKEGARFPNNTTGAHDDLPRAILIATLKARKAMVEG